MTMDFSALGRGKGIIHLPSEIQVTTVCWFLGKETERKMGEE